jgi:sigma-B regulation protein RsbU (phosphoserine phosphatase)
MTLRWSNALRRVTTAGPYVEEKVSTIVLTFVIVAGIAGVAYADKSVTSLTLASLYFLPLALSALIHPLRVSIALSIVCLVLHDVLRPLRDFGIRHLIRDAATLLGFLFVVIVLNQLAAQRRRLAGMAAKQRDELANEIHMAAEVQQSILPRSIPTVAGFEFAARMYPARIVAGDYYGFVELAKEEIAVVIADVSGKGVAAGLLMPSIEVALRMDAPRFPRTSDLLQVFNNVVHQITSGRRFITLFYGKLCPQSRFLEYTNAGHNPPLLIRAGADPRPLDQGGPVLGVLPDAEYKNDSIALCRGDVLVLYTDGVVETENPTGEEYAAARLATVVSSHLQESADQLIESIHASVTQFRGAAPQADDMTLVTLKAL